jgi:long-chain acyl-CoA synthetase
MTIPDARRADDDPALSRPTTIARLPFFTTGRFPKPTLIGQCRGDEVVYTSGRDLVPRVRDISLGLQSLGLRPGDRVAIVSESRPEWLFVDFAVLTAGAVTAPVYPTLSSEQVAFILRDAGAEIVVVSTSAQWDKVVAALARGDVPALTTIVTIESVEDSDAPAGVKVVTLADVGASGHSRIQGGWGVAREFQQAAERVQPEDLATIIYTSGTTGDPKGVMLTHANLVANLTGVLERLDLSDDDVALSFLPLCHALERIVSYVYMMTGISMVFVESFDTIARDLLRVRPTVMSGVPRVFEKLKARIDEKVAQAPALRRMVFHWASRVAVASGTYQSSGRALPLGLRLASTVADRLAFAKIRQGVGGRLRYAVSGSAPLNPDLARFFLGAGLPILEGYGLTETSPVLTVMPIDAIRFGTVGPPLSNVEIRIADDGEILARGPNVMRGYFNRPQETADVLRDGWFHTGDVGTLDERGYLSVTDRKKDVIVTSGGKKVAPQPIENTLRADPLVAEAILVGDRRHFVAALLVPDLAVLAVVLGQSRDHAVQALASSDVRSRYQAVVDRVNQPLAQFERIKKFAFITDEISMANGLLTPSLKIRRRVIDERFQALIDDLYRAG